MKPVEQASQPQVVKASFLLAVHHQALREDLGSIAPHEALDWGSSGYLPLQRPRPPVLIAGSALEDICLRFKESGLLPPISQGLQAPALQPSLGDVGQVP